LYFVFSSKNALFDFSCWGEYLGFCELWSLASLLRHLLCLNIITPAKFHLTCLWNNNSLVLVIIFRWLLQQIALISWTQPSCDQVDWIAKLNFHIQLKKQELESCRFVVTGLLGCPFSLVFHVKTIVLIVFLFPLML
jgi:hypothetical protein